MRINTAEAPTIRRPQIVSNDGYEPPAAIQNAMLTKDKKPFTYTPGMGGKLDLSQIRSPRMARRVAKNANDEGIEGPPKSALEPKPTPPPSAGANLFVQPQVAVPVFPTNVPPQPTVNRTPSTPPTNRTPPTPPVNRTPTTPPLAKATVNGTFPEKQPEPVKNLAKVETKMAPIIVSSVQVTTPEGPSTPTQVTLTKAPTPWLQNKVKPPEELPEWAKRTSMGKQSSTSPESPPSPPAFVPVVQKQQPAQQKQQPQQYQYQPPSPPQQQQQQPQQFNQQPQKRAFPSPTVTQTGPQAQPQERMIPIRIEDRPSVFDVKPEPGHQQFKQPPSAHHQQRWGQVPGQTQVQPQQPQPSSGGGYIIPIMIEGGEKRVSSGPGSNAPYAHPTSRNSTVDSQPVKIVQQRGPVVVQPAEQGPVQSRSFRVLQKITDTDLQNDVDPEQLRKLQLSEDDRILMNKFKEQVDSDTFLHQEEDPRYRGAAIPSRAFRFLQTMTDAGEAPVTATTPRAQNVVNKKQNRNSKSFEETQANLPPSEQQAPEPKKYMGSAIPSRSFRILQAMTAPERVGPDATDY